MSEQAFLAACVQMNSGTNVARNMANVAELIREAAGAGAHYVQTPEMTTIVQKSRKELELEIHPLQNNPSIAEFSTLANELGIWLHIGSMAITLAPQELGQTISNRAFIFQPDGAIAAHYDKIHMYDVDLDNGESWRESNTYRPGDEAVIAKIAPNGLQIELGLAICYDVRFAALYRAYAQKGASVLCAPAVFTKQSGEAHWHVLQRARAIENGAFMISAAQAGHLEDGRDTFGHSIIVDPWGNILAEADGFEPGVITAQITPKLALEARAKIPALVSDRPFKLKMATGSGLAS